MKDVTITTKVSTLLTKGYQKIREAMINNVQDIVKEALMRAIRRESSLNSL